MISSPELCADPAPVQEPNVPSEASHIMTRQVLVRLVVSSSLCSGSLCPGIPDDPILSWLPASYILGALSFMGYFATPCRGTDNGATLICPVKGGLYERARIQNDSLKDHLKPNNTSESYRWLKDNQSSF